MAERPGRCWYCGRESLAVGDPPEHVLPSVLGAELTTEKVCRGCNTKAGEMIDRPFVSDWFIGWSRLIYDIRDPRHGKRPPPLPDEELELPNGTPARWTRDGTVEPIPKVEHDQHEVRATARSEDEAREILRKLEERYGRKGKTVSAGPFVTQEWTEVKGHADIDALSWLRMTIKVAVASASLVLDESWLDTDEAATYRSYLWDATPKFADGSDALAYPGLVPSAVEQLCAPPDHLLMFFPIRPGATAFSMAVFGKFTAGTVHFSTPPGAEQPTRAWRLDPMKRKVNSTTRDDLLTRAAARYLPKRAS